VVKFFCNKPFLHSGIFGFLLYLCLLVVVGLFIYQNNHQHHLKLPHGCDQFGYLNLAKAVNERELFDNHAERPFLPQLLPHLKNTFSAERQYQFMIAPHCYHLSPANGVIINQYPPGLGLMLSILPEHMRQILFPVVCFFLIWLAWAICWWLSGNRDWVLCSATFLILSTVYYFLDPVSREFHHVHSVVVTYGLLLAAGWLLPGRPGLAIVFLGAASLFRFPTIIFLVPLYLVFLSKDGESSFTSQMFMQKSIKTALYFLMGGFGVYLIYVWILLGNPFLPTYSVIDQQSADFNRVLSNIYFYFVDNPGWLYVNLLSLFLLTVVATIRKAKSWWLFGLLLFLYNYGFFITHHVQIHYYPYATAFLIAGLALSLLLEDNINPKIRLFLIVSSALIAVSIMTSINLAGTQYNSNLPQYYKQISAYQKAFGKFDIVWAEERSGTVEYATNRAGFRYNWGPDNARSEIIKFLQANGYSQLIWASDPGMPEKEIILNFLKQNKIPFNRWESADMGQGITIPITH